MPVNHYTVTISVTTSFQLSSVVTVGDPIKFIALQADAGNAGAIFVGGTAGTLSSSDYGIRIPVPVTSVPAAPIQIGPHPGLLSAGEIYIVGTTTDKLHVLVVT